MLRISLTSIYKLATRRKHWYRILTTTTQIFEDLHEQTKLAIGIAPTSYVGVTRATEYFTPFRFFAFFLVWFSAHESPSSTSHSFAFVFCGLNLNSHQVSFISCAPIRCTFVPCEMEGRSWRGGWASLLPRFQWLELFFRSECISTKRILPTY